MLKRFFRRKILGFSLFEVLLVLVVASMLAVAAIKYAKQQQEEAAAQLYGTKLYTFGQGVREYVKDSGLGPMRDILIGTKLCGAAGFCNGRQGQSDFSETYNNDASGTRIGRTTVAKGIDWLKAANSGKAYITDKFNFDTDLSPLFVAKAGSSGLPLPNTRGNAAITTTIYVPTDPGQSVTITISPGALYRPVPGTDPTTNQPLPPVLIPALTQKALNHANTMYDPVLGLPAIAYDYPYLDPTTGASTPAAPITGTIAAAGAAAAVEYLMTDGSNTMKGDISFDAAATSRRINSVENITFMNNPTIDQELQFGSNAMDTSRGVIRNVKNIFLGPTPVPGMPPSIVFNTATGGSTNGGGMIQGLTHIQMQSSTGNLIQAPTIGGLQTLNFDGTALSSITGLNTIEGLQTLNFDGTASSSITGLNVINFANGRIFKGLEYVSLTQNGVDSSNNQTSNYPPTAGNYLKATGFNRLSKYDFMCFLSNVMTNDDVAGSATLRRCELDVDSSNYWFLNWKNIRACQAVCYRFAK